MDRLENPCFGEVENVVYVVANMDRNLKGTKESVQHEKCFVTYVFNPSGVSKPWANWKTKFMLRNYNLVSMYLEENDEILSIQVICI